MVSVEKYRIPLRSVLAANVNLKFNLRFDTSARLGVKSAILSRPQRPLGGLALTEVNVAMIASRLGRWPFFLTSSVHSLHRRHLWRLSYKYKCVGVSVFLCRRYHLALDPL